MRGLKFCYLLMLTVLLYNCSTDEQIATSGSGLSHTSAGYIEIEALSTKPWLVTDGNVLLEISLTHELDIGLLRYSLNGQNVSSMVRSVSPTTTQALLEGLPLGESQFVVSSSKNNYSKALTLVNYPVSGPIVSGDHEEPFLCETDRFETVSGGLLPQSTDENCSIQTQVEYVYWSFTDETYKSWQSAYEINPPSDLGYISIQNIGFKPFIVRVETGVVNRAIYEIAMLRSEVNQSLTAIEYH